MNLAEPVVGINVTITLEDGSVLKNCWYQHDGSFVIACPYIQSDKDAVVWVDGRYVRSWEKSNESS